MRWMIRTRSAVVAALILFLSGCAYNYAGNEGKVRKEPVERTQTEVVELKQTSTPADEAREALEPESTSKCGIEVFTTYYYDATTQVERQVRCDDKTVVEVKRKPLGESLYTDRKKLGYPEETWFILVDPRGVKAAHLNNDHLLKLSREFRIEFHGRAADGLLVYLFHEKVT